MLKLVRSTQDFAWDGIRNTIKLLESPDTVAKYKLREQSFIRKRKLILKI